MRNFQRKIFNISRKDHDLDHDIQQMIYIVQIQPRKHELDHADYTAPSRQHDLDHTDHTDHTDHLP